ncbi:MAG: sodium-dependent transporter [Cyclobacteriaceae bacterium]|nr:sodium-dependent transporter [Cyclobacteriaceae bacterium]
MANRGGFSSKLGFIMAAAGSAVGLGNIWKFPFEVGNGGGAAFVFIYLIFCFILCLPVMITEIAIGRKTQLNPVGAFSKLGFKGWRNLGKLGLISGFLILSFYNVVAGWAFGYFIEILLGNFEIGQNFSAFTSNVIKVGGYATIFMVSTAFIVSKGISGGIEKASKILMPTLILIILSLVAYSFTLEHSIEGLKFYLVPDFSKITLPVIYGALGQAFFSLSLGMGALITYGSYVGKNDNIITSAVLITLTDVGIAFIAGLMMFPLVAYMTEGGVAEYVQGGGGGAGLIFSTLPSVFEKMGPTLGVVIGSLFFLLLSFAALTSTVSLLEVPVSYVVDEHKVKRTRAVWGVAILIFIVGIPSLLGNGYSTFFTEFVTYFGAEKPTDFMTFIGHVANDTFLPLGGFLISVFAAYVWKKASLSDEISQGYPNYKGSIVEKYINFTISYLCPTILGVLFILTVLDRFFSISVVG